MTDRPVTADWIAVDWGTSNMRAWAMASDGTVLAEARSDQGMDRLSAGAHGFEPALMALVGDWLKPNQGPGHEATRGPIDVVACGMVGARQGWVEAGYRPVPAAPVAPAGLTRAPCRSPDIAVYIAGGISQTNPPDVMRGEETQIAGLLAAAPGFAGVVAMPGTHTKWVQIIDAEVFHFGSFMTGEIFALLAKSSVLRHTVDAGGHDPAAFLEAFEETLSHPERFAARLFGLRAADMLQGIDRVAAASRLSGALLGLEFAGAKPYWLGQPIALVAQGSHAERYGAALTSVGASFTVHDPDACVLDGLRAAHADLTSATSPALK